MAESRPARPRFARRCGEYHIRVVALKQPAAVPAAPLAGRAGRLRPLRCRISRLLDRLVRRTKRLAISVRPQRRLQPIGCGRIGKRGRIGKSGWKLGKIRQRRRDPRRWLRQGSRRQGRSRRKAERFGALRPIGDACALVIERCSKRAENSAARGRTRGGARLCQSFENASIRVRPRRSLSRKIIARRCECCEGVGEPIRPDGRLQMPGRLQQMIGHCVGSPKKKSSSANREGLAVRLSHFDSQGLDQYGRPSDPP